MEALSSLVHRAEPGAPLARALGAILDSGLVVTTRDGAGRFVQVSDVLGQRLGIGDRRGAVHTNEIKYHSDDGRLLSVSEVPAQQVRTSGQGRRNELNRLETADGVLWMQQSHLPLEQTAEGWSVLTIGADVTELVEHRTSAEQAVSMRGELLRLSVELAERSVGYEELVELLREPMAALVPEGNVLIMRQMGSDFEMTTVHHGFGASLQRRRSHFPAEMRERWSAASAHVNQDVRETDIYGARVVAELENPFRSLVIAPSSSPNLEQLGALAMHHPEPEAFDRWQIESLELTARLVSGALHSDDIEDELRSA
jgi:hypothetical protein